MNIQITLCNRNHDATLFCGQKVFLCEKMDFCVPLKLKSITQMMQQGLNINYGFYSFNALKDNVTCLHKQWKRYNGNEELMWMKEVQVCCQQQITMDLHCLVVDDLCFMIFQ